MATTVEAPPSRARANAIGWGGDPRVPVRRNRGRIAAAVVLMVVCGWLAAVVFLSVGDRREVVALGRSVPRYQELTEDDLRVVRVAADEGVSTLPAGRIDDLVGRVAATDLAPGTLLSEKQLLAEGQRAVGDGEAVVGTLLAAADSPDTLPRGARVQVIVRPATGSVDGTTETIRGWILDVAWAEQAAGGGRKVSLVVPAESAETVAAGASEKRVSVVVLGGS